MFEGFFGGNGDVWSTIVWFVLFIFFIIFGPRLMVTQSILKLERDVSEIEEMAKKAKSHVYSFVAKSPTPKIRGSIDGFMEFFAVEPVSADPYGVMKKLDHIIKRSDKRFNYFVNQITPNFSKEDKRNLKGALGGAITTYQVAKILRHMLEIIKKYKMFQLAMVLQMQIPLIARMAKSALAATKAFTDGIPIGDGIGPLVIASMIKGKVKLYDDEEFVYTETKINGNKIILAKADGTGATVGMPGKFVKKLLKRKKINRIITVDAGMKLEGEKSGTLAEGVGVAMNPAGTDRYDIEEITVRKNIPLDAIIIKVSDEEALMPMKKEIANSVPNAINLIKENINREKRKETILVMGVGNTCGIGNNHKEALEGERKLRAYLRKMEKQKKKKKIFK